MNRLIPLLFGLILTSLAWSDDLVDGEMICGPNTCDRMGSRWSPLKTRKSLVSKPIEIFLAR
jgi:hypothetical protein